MTHILLVVGAVLVGLWVAWAALMLWLVYGRGPFQSCYNALVARYLRRAGMQAVTIGARCFLSEPDARLSPSGFAHERWHHLQWRCWPLTFVFRYLWENARVGYDKNCFEQEARAAAGEPLR